MRLNFTKMHGLGNDFVVLDAISQRFELTPFQVRQLADRHFGVGCDQVLLVEPPRDPNTDFHYRIFNADGGEVAQCGNGARCFARFVKEKGLSDKPVSAVKPCAACRGTGRQACPACDGRGTVTCRICNGSGARPRCGECRGAGTPACDRCGGTGQLDGRLCPGCDGCGRVKCPPSGGDGREPVDAGTDGADD